MLAKQLLRANGRGRDLEVVFSFGFVCFASLIVNIPLGLKCGSPAFSYHLTSLRVFSIKQCAAIFGIGVEDISKPHNAGKPDAIGPMLSRGELFSSRSSRISISRGLRQSGHVGGGVPYAVL